MRTPFFHDWNYGGYFSAPHGFGGDATFVSDADVDKVNGNVGKALRLFGKATALNPTDPYHRMRARGNQIAAQLHI